MVTQWFVTWKTKLYLLPSMTLVCLVREWEKIKKNIMEINIWVKLLGSILITLLNRPIEIFRSCLRCTRHFQCMLSSFIFLNNVCKLDQCIISYNFKTPVEMCSELKASSLSMLLLVRHLHSNHCKC